MRIWENERVNREMMLLYDNNQDNVENIALFSRSGGASGRQFPLPA